MQANIKEQRFGVDFFKSFDIVLNGLDNLEARRHVNRLCLASRTPLVESGTAGYLGQVSFFVAQYLQALPGSVVWKKAQHSSLSILFLVLRTCI